MFRETLDKSLEKCSKFRMILPQKLNFECSLNNQSLQIFLMVPQNFSKMDKILHHLKFEKNEKRKKKSVLTITNPPSPSFWVGSKE
jgi:hypothetical protein